MSMTNITVGFGALALITNLVVTTVFPIQSGITVYDVVYAGGQVSQDRLVRAPDHNEAFFASWAATVINADTDDAVPWCDGRGSFPYKAGRKSVTMTLQEWVGSPTCTAESLPPGNYFLRGVWYWGAAQTSKDSGIFTIGNAE